MYHSFLIHSFADGHLGCFYEAVFLKGFPMVLLDHPWASLIAQLVKNPPARQETLVLFLGQKDPLEKG